MSFWKKRECHLVNFTLFALNLTRFFSQISFAKTRPSGVIAFVPSDGPTFGSTITASKHLRFWSFIFEKIKQNIFIFQRDQLHRLGANVQIHLEESRRESRQIRHLPETYRGYCWNIKFSKSRTSECGGKNFHFVHPSADLQSVVTGKIHSIIYEMTVCKGMKGGVLANLNYILPRLCILLLPIFFQCWCFMFADTRPPSIKTFIS